ncbi:MAG: hypothetical protein HY681_15270 [Chloroflexi bacterium]|nr:hypothetical protein [Chloroflexota bacterium]
MAQPPVSQSPFHKIIKAAGAVRTKNGIAALNLVLVFSGICFRHFSRSREGQIDFNGLDVYCLASVCCLRRSVYKTRPRDRRRASQLNKRLLIGIACLGLAIVACSPSGPTASEMATAEAKIASLQQSVATTQGQLSESQRNAQALQSKLDDTAKQMVTAQQQLTQTAQTVKGLQETISDTAKQLDTAKAQLATLQTKLDDTAKQLVTAQQQLAQSAQTVKSLQGTINDTAKQLDASKAQLATAQADLTVLKTPPLTPSDPVVTKGSFGAKQRISVPIELQAFEQVQGELFAGGYDLTFYIQDPSGALVRDFGTVVQTNFQFTAQIPGRYTLFFANPDARCCIAYTLRYTVYHK